MSDGLKQMVERDRMIVEATVVIETDDDHALDLSGVGRMLKEHLEPLSAEVVELILIGYGDEDEDDEDDDVGPGDRAAGPSAAELAQEYRESILADPEGYLTELDNDAMSLALGIDDVADVLASRPDMAERVARLRTASAGLWAMDR